MIVPDRGDLNIRKLKGDIIISSLHYVKKPLKWLIV
jgi:hypothetical protein